MCLWKDTGISFSLIQITNLKRAPWSTEVKDWRCNTKVRDIDLYPVTTVLEYPICF